MAEYCYDIKMARTSSGGSEVRMYYSTVARSGLASSDALIEDQFIPGRVNQPGVIELDLWGSGRTRGPREPGNGMAVFENSDGGLDAFKGYALDSGFYTVQRTLASNPSTADTTVIFNGLMERCEVTEESVNIYLRDQIHRYNKAALPTRYAGTNALPAGIEGTPEDLGGKSKPAALGICLNVTPAFVNTSRLIYQLDGQQGFLTGWSLVVYDARTVLTEDGAGDYTDQTDMETNAPTAGQYRVWPAGGCFRLGSAPTGQITCDITNPAIAGGSTGLTPAASTSCEVHAILGRLAYLSGLTAPQIISYLAVNPQCGIYLTGEVTYLQAMNELMQGVSAGWYLNPGSSLDILVRELEDPASETSVQDFTDENIISFKPLVSADSDRGIPVWRVVVRYGKNYTLQNASELAGASQADVAFTGQEYRTVFAADSAIKTQWPRSPEIVIDSLISAEADAQNEADRLLALYDQLRDQYAMEVPTSIVTTRHLGEFVTVTYARFGLNAGKKFMVIGKKYNFERDTVVLTLWG